MGQVSLDLGRFDPLLRETRPPPQESEKIHGYWNNKQGQVSLVSFALLTLIFYQLALKLYKTTIYQFVAKKWLKRIYMSENDFPQK